MAHNYAHQTWNPQSMARASGRDLGVSTKESVEICRHIKDKNIADAKKMLNAAVELKRPIALSRFNQKVAHKPGMGPGRYLCSTAKSILSVIENLEANAQQKGLSMANLVIVHACAHQAARPFHASRKRGRRMKRTHVELVCEEKAVEKKKIAVKKPAKPGKTAEKKSEAKVTPAKPKVEEKAVKAVKVAEEKSVEPIAESQSTPAEPQTVPAVAKPEVKLEAGSNTEQKTPEEKPDNQGPAKESLGPKEMGPVESTEKPKEESQ